MNPFFESELFESELQPGTGTYIERPNVLGVRNNPLLGSDVDLDKLEDELEGPSKSASKGDLWVFGLTLTATLGEAGKNIAEWTTYDGGGRANFLDNVGELPVAVALSLALWNTAKGTGGYVTMWTFLMGSAVSIVTVIESMAGFGAPDQGTGFTNGTRKLKALERTLQGVDPDPSQWAGDAASVYGTRNSVLKDLADQMAILDQQMADLVKIQAQQADTVRQGMAGTKLALEVGIVIVAGLLPWAVADPTQAAAQVLGKVIMIVGGIAFLTASGLGITGLIQGAQNASAAAGVANSYGDVVSKSAPPSAPAPNPVTPVGPAPSPVSPAPSPVSPAAPAPAPSPGSPSSPVSPRRPPVSPAAPAAAASSDPAPAAASPTTLESLASAMGLAMQAEPGMAQAASQGMQSVQQFAQMAAQAGKHRDPAPASGPAPAGMGQDGASDTSDASGDPDRAAGATGGVAGAGRAPVDSAAPAATGTAEQSERSL
jgi:hypothetical protein